MRLLVVTNDFPPRPGGIEHYVAELVRHLPQTASTVLTSEHPDAERFDPTYPQHVVRCGRYPLLPTPRLLRTVVDWARHEPPDAIVFGAAVPLGLIARALTRRLAVPIVMCTHGVEPVLAALPGGAAVVRRALSSASLVTCVSDWAERRLRRTLAPGVPLIRVPPGIDPERFHPGVDRAEVRRRFGLTTHPVVVSVARLVPRKGIDRLVTAWPAVLRQVPGARLLVVGDGPDRARLDRLARRHGVTGAVVFAGRVDADALPGCLAAGDVFALPCRSRWGGLDTEAWGTVFTEAAAVGRAAIAGHAGGASEAVLDGETGLVVDARRVEPVAAAVVRLLMSGAEARRLGAAGATRVHHDLTWTRLARRFHDHVAQTITSGAPV